jgi:hypothetical protein
MKRLGIALLLALVALGGVSAAPADEATGPDSIQSE